MHNIYILFIIVAQQTGQGPKVKKPPPVPPKPKRDQSQPAIKPQTAPAAPQPKQLDLSSQQPQNPSSVEKPQDPLSIEYITLREISAVLVDLLAGNAPVITQLNNHLFAPGLIPKAVHIAVETVGLSPYDRANKIINAVLATLECHPNPNSAFTSIITALYNVGLFIIATKLSDALSKRI